MRDEILTIKDVAAYLKVAEKTIYRLAHRHQLKHYSKCFLDARLRGHDSSCVFPGVFCIIPAKAGIQNKALFEGFSWKLPLFLIS